MAELREMIYYKCGNVFYIAKPEHVHRCGDCRDVKGGADGIRREMALRGLTSKGSLRVISCPEECVECRREKGKSLWQTTEDGPHSLEELLRATRQPGPDPILSDDGSTVQDSRYGFLSKSPNGTPSGKTGTRRSSQDSLRRLTIRNETVRSNQRSMTRMGSRRDVNSALLRWTSPVQAIRESRWHLPTTRFASPYVWTFGTWAEDLIGYFTGPLAASWSESFRPEGL